MTTTFITLDEAADAVASDVPAAAGIIRALQDRDLARQAEMARLRRRIAELESAAENS